METIKTSLQNVSSDSCTEMMDDRPLSPVLNSSSLSQKSIYSRKRNRLKSKVNLIDRFSLEQTPLCETKTKQEPLSNILSNPKLLDDLPAGEKIKKIKEIEEARRKFANHFYIDQKSLNENCAKTEVSNALSADLFKKPVVKSNNGGGSCKGENTTVSLQFEQIKNSKQVDEPIFKGFRTGSGIEMIVSLDSIKKHSTLFEDILKPGELNENVSKLILDSKMSTNAVSQNNKKSQIKDIGNKTMLQTSITDTQFNLAGDIAISVDFDSWTKAEFDTSIVDDNKSENVDLNKKIDTTLIKCEPDFKGFHELLTEHQPENLYTNLIKHMEEEISLILNKTKFPTATNKRSSSSFTTNSCKRFKFDTESNPHLVSIESISNIDELKMKTNVVLKSADSKNYLHTASNTVKEHNQPLPEKLHQDDLSGVLISLKNKFPSTASINAISIEAVGFQTASGKGIQISNKAWSTASNILQEGNLPDFDKSKLINNKKFPISHGKDNEVSNNAKIPNEYNLKNEHSQVDSLNSASFGSTVESKPMGFQAASGKGIQISNKALSKASNILQEENLPNFNKNNSGECIKKDNFRKPLSENDAASSESWNNEEEFSDVVEKWLESTICRNDKVGTGFSSASGKKIEISNKAWNRAGNVLKEDNLPVLGEKQIKSHETLESGPRQGFSVGDFASASKQNLKISNRASCGSQKENCLHIPEDQIKNKPLIKTNKKEEILPKNGEKDFKSNSLLRNTNYSSGSMSGGFSSVSGKSIDINKKALIKASNLLNEDDLIKTQNKSQNDSSSVKRDSKLSYGGLNSLPHKNELPSVCKRNSVQVNEHIIIPKKKWIPFQSPIKVSSNENLCHESKSTPAKDGKNSFSKLNDFELSVNNLHNTPKGSIKTSTITRSNKKRLGVSITKQMLIPKEKLQRASLIFEELGDEKPISTTYSQLNIYSSTPVKNCDVNTKPILETFNNENNCLNNVNITPIKNISAHKNVKMDIEVETNTDLLCDQDGAVVLKKCSTLNSLENIDMEYRSLEMQLQNLLYKKQILDSQREFLTSNKDCSHISPRHGVLTKKKFSQQRISWGQYVENVEPGTVTTREALENGVSRAILAISAKNANDVHISCDRNDQNKSVVHTEDGAIVVSNSRNLVGLAEIITAFEVMPGIDSKLLPRDWISNHFKWIVWKLASLERNFPDKFFNFLTVENLIQQLKYRYDREIDNAERPALRKILEKDDVPQKKMVLCVADIIKLSPDCFELELTDGWYSLRTIIDRPLCKQVKRDKIVVGTKLITQCAELLNCDDGCHPLEVSDNVRLKIFYNCTRRARWNSKLGFQRVLQPFPISLCTVLPDGGCIGCIKVFIARVYPIRYMEKETNGRTVLRNKRAEDKKAQEWETKRTKAIEVIQHKVQRDYEAQKLTDVPKCKIALGKQSLLAKTDSPIDLFEMLKSTNDPEGFKSMLSSDQLAEVMDYEMNFHYQQQQELSNIMEMELKNLKFQSRNVTPVLKLCVTELSENNEQSEIGYTFNIYKPTEEHLQSITEGSTFSVYNVMPKHNGEIVANNKTHFKLESTLVKVNKMMRSVIPIASLCQTKKPMLNEFDTIGTIVQLHKNDNSQSIWLTDFLGNLLLVKVIAASDKCSLIDNLSKGHSIAIMNLIFCTSKYCFEQALANQSTLITRYPRHSLLQGHLLEHCNQLPKDLTQLMNECDKKIEESEAIVNSSKNYKNSTNSLIEPTNLCDLFDDSYADTTEKAMSLIDMDQFFDNSTIR